MSARVKWEATYAATLGTFDLSVHRSPTGRWTWMAACHATCDYDSGRGDLSPAVAKRHAEAAARRLARGGR